MLFSKHRFKSSLNIGVEVEILRRSAPQDFGCGLALGFASLTTARRLNFR